MPRVTAKRQKFLRNEFGSEAKKGHQAGSRGSPYPRGSATWIRACDLHSTGGRRSHDLDCGSTSPTRHRTLTREIFRFILIVPFFGSIN